MRQGSSMVNRTRLGRDSRPHHLGSSAPWFGRAYGLLGWLRQPLTIAQALSSLAGAGAMVLAAAAMVPAEFSQYALFTLATLLLTGLCRAALYQAALITQRRLPNSHVPWHYAAVSSLGSGLGMAAVCWALGVRDPTDLAWLGVSALVPAWFDWLNTRGIALDRRWKVVGANLLRVLLTAAAAASPQLRSDSVALQSYMSLSLLVPTLYLLLRLPRIPSWVPYRTYARAGGWQLVDFLLGQSLQVLPLLVLGGTGSGAVAGVRLAQSILGPFNLVAAAAATNLLADGATRPEFATARSVIDRGTRIGRNLATLALGLVGTLVTLTWLTGFDLRGVDNASLLLGLILFGGSIITSGWSNVHLLVLRILDHQARATVARAVVAVLTVSGFVTGYLVGGTTSSLIVGFVTLTLATPLIFRTMSARVYRRIH